MLFSLIIISIMTNYKRKISYSPGDSFVSYRKFSKWTHQNTNVLRIFKSNLLPLLILRTVIGINTCLYMCVRTGIILYQQNVQNKFWPGCHFEAARKLKYSQRSPSSQATVVNCR